MRRVATELGAGPMSLYRHVRDKDDLLLRMMLAQHDAEGFGACTNIGECAAACPKQIPLDVISQLNWDLHAAMRHGH